jgi:hypothetical protein
MTPLASSARVVGSGTGELAISAPQTLSELRMGVRTLWSSVPEVEYAHRGAEAMLGNGELGVEVFLS